MCLMDTKKVKPISVDAISTLPDEMLALILSFLPTKQAASTSILSKRWRNLFPRMTQHHFVLDLSYPVHPNERKIISRFNDFVEKTISSSNLINNLSLILRDGLFSPVGGKGRHKYQWYDEKSWILQVVPPLYPRAIHYMPGNVFKNETLVKLTLRIELGSNRIVLPEVLFLPMLKSLNLYTHWNLGQRLCEKMLPCCPILEELCFHQLCGVTNYQDEGFLISHETLKRVTVQCYDNLHQDCLMVYDIPSLVYFDYPGFYPHCNSNGEFLESLVEFKLNVECDSTRDQSRVISRMHNVKSLSLSCASTKMMISYSKELAFFSNLVKLSFESNTIEGWAVLSPLLHGSPKLETLTLKGLHYVRKEGVSIQDHNVQVLEIYGFRGSGKEFRQVKEFLRKMKLLRVIKVEIIGDDTIGDDTKKVQLMNDLLALPERSSHCPIKFL